MKENSKQGKMLRLLPAMVVTVALVMLQVSCSQKSANDEGQDAENQQNEIVQNDNLPQDAVSEVDEKVANEEAVKKPDANNIKKDDKQDKSVVYKITDVPASYPGGEIARQQFLQENIKYPETALASKIEGTVYVTFVIEINGSISDAKILRGIGGGCDEEVIRIVKLMPNWIPAKQGGNVVRCQYNMPIKFSLPIELPE